MKLIVGLRYQFTQEEDDTRQTVYVTALQDFDTEEVGQEWLDLHGYGKKRYGVDLEAFFSYLLRKKYIEEYEIFFEETLHIGAYGTLSRDFRNDGGPVG